MAIISLLTNAGLITVGVIIEMLCAMLNEF
jgi:hypothetical protein